ncbi:MAG: hypothetical protein RL322_622 [Pseudomonadota bacterium]|jgi:16S rRNA (cytidine1402-2'-O)-methyltransferase
MHEHTAGLQRPDPGQIWLIPTPIGDPLTLERVLPQQTLEILRSVDYFIAERARTARSVLKAAGIERAIQSISIAELNEHTSEAALPALLEPVLAGQDAGLMSEAGCPAVADPGAPLIALAHRHGIRVRPLVGPSAILLALMASGLNGQCFAFAGYLPQDAGARDQRLMQLEARSAGHNETQLFIETPYRNQAVFDAMIARLSPTTEIMVARSITLADESIETRTVQAWRSRQRVDLPRTPTVFGLLAPSNRARRPGPSSSALGSPKTQRRTRR